MALAPVIGSQGAWQYVTRTSVDHLLHALGVAVADESDLVGCVVDRGDVAGGRHDVGGADVFIVPFQPPGAGNGDDP